MAWIAFRSDPQEPMAREHLATELDLLIRTRLPNGRFGELLQGHEADMRQEAHVLILRFLSGNRELSLPTEDENLVEIENQIQRSVSGCCRAVFFNFRKRALRYRAFHNCGVDVDAVEHPVCMHPANRTRLWELPIALQRKIIIQIMGEAVRDHLLCPQNAAIASDMVMAEKSQSEIAKSRGISRQAVHARLTKIRSLLGPLLETTEFPSY